MSWREEIRQQHCGSEPPSPRHALSCRHLHQSLELGSALSIRYCGCIADPTSGKGSISRSSEREGFHHVNSVRGKNPRSEGSGQIPRSSVPCFTAFRVGLDYKLLYVEGAGMLILAGFLCNSLIISHSHRSVSQPAGRVRP
jgi:hypothetical protein